MERHLGAIRDWGAIDDASSLRRFLGNFQWVRPHLPNEYIIPLAILTKMLRKGAEFPMPAEACRAQAAIQALAIRAVRLGVLDEVAAVSGARPLEQVADVCAYGYGGSAWQASPDCRVLNVLGQYAGLLTVAQAHYHPRLGELFAQRQVARQRRKHLGPVPALCWTDHRHLVADLVAPEADAMCIRWLSDLEGRGDRLRNLAGRACHLADGQSRKHPGHIDTLKRDAVRLRRLTLDDILDSDMGSSDEEPWGIPSSQAPRPVRASGGMPALGPVRVAGAAAGDLEDPLAVFAAAVGEDFEAVGLFLPPHASEGRCDRQAAGWATQIRQTVPRLSLKLIPVTPLLADDFGQSCFFVPPFALPPAKYKSALRRDFMTSVAGVMQVVARLSPRIVVGSEQGGVIALGLASSPRVVEIALATRAALPSEAVEFALAWHGLRANVVAAPRFHAVSRLVRLQEAVPELFRAAADGEAERSVPVFALKGPNPQQDFEDALCAALPVPVVGFAGDALSAALLAGAAPPGAVGTGTCACGRPALILRRCATCTRQDLAEMPPHPWQGRPLGEPPAEDPDREEVEEFYGDEAPPVAAIGPERRSHPELLGGCVRRLEFETLAPLLPTAGCEKFFFGGKVRQRRGRRWSCQASDAVCIIPLSHRHCSVLHRRRCRRVLAAELRRRAL